MCSAVPRVSLNGSGAASLLRHQYRVQCGRSATELRLLPERPSGRSDPPEPLGRSWTGRLHGTVTGTSCPACQVLENGSNVPASFPRRPGEYSLFISLGWRGRRQWEGLPLHQLTAIALLTRTSELICGSSSCEIYQSQLWVHNEGPENGPGGKRPWRASPKRLAHSELDFDQDAIYYLVRPCPHPRRGHPAPLSTCASTGALTVSAQRAPASSSAASRHVNG